MVDVSELVVEVVHQATHKAENTERERRRNVLTWVTGRLNDLQIVGNDTHECTHAHMQVTTCLSPWCGTWHCLGYHKHTCWSMPHSTANKNRTALHHTTCKGKSLQLAPTTPNRTLPPTLLIFMSTTPVHYNTNQPLWWPASRRWLAQTMVTVTRHACDISQPLWPPGTSRLQSKRRSSANTPLKHV